MKNKKQFWTTAALINLAVVAMLGVTLRSKILFPIEALDFKFVLHAHSHFAFGGWITLALLTLMTYEILPAQLHQKKIYHWLLWGIMLNACGMLVSFLCQGYAFFSILFSTLFIFVTYGFTYVFIRDILKAKTERSITVLCISALACISLSSAGPFTLAYLVASHSTNHLLYRDSIYTYLHLQYNGFFTLAVFALFYNNVYKRLIGTQLDKARRFAYILSFSVFPSLFISYLWHFPNLLIRTVAIAGCVCILISVPYFFMLLQTVKKLKDTFHPFIYKVGLLSFAAFIIKSLLQTGTVIPALGKLVFGDRAIIIGFLHLVLLGFISLYLLAQMLHSQLLDVSGKRTRIAVMVFTGGIIANETVLMVQGFGNMLMIGNDVYAWLLWGAALWLFAGATMIAIARLRYYKSGKPAAIYQQKTFQSIIN
jgi:hypothetical protein